MRHYNVANIFCTETKLLDPPHGCVVFMKLKSGNANPLLAQSLNGLLNIQQANPSVNESQPRAIVQKQAVANHCWKVRDQQRSAIDVMDFGDGKCRES